jgi:hypothetical protein
MEIDMSTLYLVDKDFKPADLDCNPHNHVATLITYIWRLFISSKHTKF